MERKAYHELSEYPELRPLIENHALIQKEIRDNELWMKWGSDNPDESGRSLFKEGDWMVCPVYFGRGDPYSLLPPTADKHLVDQILTYLPQRFPKTVELLKQVPNVKFAGFSKLDPRSTLKPHRHDNRHSLIFHLGLVIPPGEKCGLKVDGQVHVWSKSGDAVLFDDNFEHGAWNDSDQTRIILYADILLPTSPWLK